ncbi:MAG: lipopolysaccharide heptosyltransferase II [Gammaproteobacteria bacterium]|nr:MAG: lipopolysaccharide heptosyltransferase II [Gammaproteobacteria bacterium]
MVMAHSLVQTLAQHHPAMSMDVLAPAWSRALTERMPEVREAIDMPLGHGELGLGLRRRLGRALSDRYDWAIVLPNSLKSALVPWWAGIPKRTGYTGEWRVGLLNDRRRLDKNRLRRTVERFVALGLPPDAPQPPQCPPPRLAVDTERARAVAERHGIDPQRPLVALAPGAEYGPAKRWPMGHFVTLARELLGKGDQVMVLGSQKDHELTHPLRALSGVHDLTGRTTLGEAVDLLSLARVTVTNDSGLMHVAAAVDSAVVALYGSSDPGFTPPLTERARILRLGLDCSPCFERECPLGHTRCLTDIRPAQVLEAMETLS